MLLHSCLSTPRFMPDFSTCGAFSSWTSVKEVASMWKVCHCCLLFFQSLEHEASKFWFVFPKLGAWSFQVLVCFSKTWSMKLPSFGLFFQNLKHEAAKFWFVFPKLEAWSCQVLVLAAVVEFHTFWTTLKLYGNHQLPLAVQVLVLYLFKRQKEFKDKLGDCEFSTTSQWKQPGNINNYLISWSVSANSLLS